MRVVAQARWVLVLDDDDFIRESLRMALEDEGYEVTEATDGAVALAFLRASPQPVVALLDLMMPGAVDGFQVVETAAADARLASRHAYIVLSAASTSRVRRAADALTGAARVLPAQAV